MPGAVESVSNPKTCAKSVFSHTPPYCSCSGHDDICLHIPTPLLMPCMIVDDTHPMRVQTEQEVWAPFGEPSVLFPDRRDTTSVVPSYHAVSKASLALGFRTRYKKRGEKGGGGGA